MLSRNTAQNRLYEAIGNLPRPSSDSELAILMTLCFGKPGRLKFLTFPYGRYEVESDFDEMFSDSFMKHHNTFHHDTSLYDYSGWFWDRVIGELRCGGIARASYGQYEASGHRDAKRLSRWVESRRRKDSRSVGAPFVRLADQLRDRKIREIRGIPVLIDGREDGASTVFNADEFGAFHV